MDARQGTLRGILDHADFGTPGAALSEAAERVLAARYLMRDEKGVIVETPRQLFARVAWAVARIEASWVKAGVSATERDALIERHARRFFDLMATLKFLPNSPTLMNAGRPNGQLSACFVLPIDDDLGRVFETLRDCAVIHKTGGGTGFNFGKLRPRGDWIKSSGGKASGPVAFLRLFDSATQIVKQGGTRRGANMAILPIDHPDIEQFISSKLDGTITNFNISVGVTDAFMTAVRSGGGWSLRNPRTGKVERTVRARQLWRKIADAAWSCGDPGVVFLDHINEANPTPELGRMESTNPCGEQPLLPYESCNLGSMNLLAYRSGDDLQWDELTRDIGTAVRFLDDIIEANTYPLESIESMTKANRKIGLGVMGWADLLMEWGIPYDSEQAVARGEAVMRRLSAIAVSASEALAAERGGFPEFDRSIWKRRGGARRRNATVTTVAPTGTISIIAGVSSGIEPVFSLAYEREALEGERLVFIHPALRRALRSCGVRSRKALLKVIETGSVAGLGEMPSARRRVLKTAMEIPPSWHVRMQEAFQRHTENGVSKTINLHAGARVSEVLRVYQEAYNRGCKGITVFRDRSKTSQVLRKGIGGRSGSRRELLETVDWLLDDESDAQLARKKASIEMATLSRAQLKKARIRGE